MNAHEYNQLETRKESPKGLNFTWSAAHWTSLVVCQTSYAERVSPSLRGLVHQTTYTERTCLGLCVAWLPSIIILILRITYKQKSMSSTHKQKKQNFSNTLNGSLRGLGNKYPFREQQIRETNNH